MSAQGEGALGRLDSPTKRSLADSALASFVLLLAFLNRLADAMQLRHALGKGSEALDLDDLLILAKRLDVKARRLRSSAAKLDTLPLPAIARLLDGSCLLLLQVSEQEALVFRPADERPTKIPRQAFTAEFSGELVLMTTRERVAGSVRAFDIGWFIPALVKYRHLLRDVLLASFFIQLLGLASPIFFQVVIDKVLVHKGLTTLEILALGLFIVSVFSVDLSPFFHPVESRAWSPFEPCWLGDATGWGAEPHGCSSDPPRCITGSLSLA
jgi:subfamily B ATP-binding cassette protein HlyB/CyaB